MFVPNPCGAPFSNRGGGRGLDVQVHAQLSVEWSESQGEWQHGPSAAWGQSRHRGHRHLQAGSLGSMRYDSTPGAHWPETTLSCVLAGLPARGRGPGAPSSPPGLCGDGPQLLGTLLRAPCSAVHTADVCRRPQTPLQPSARRDAAPGGPGCPGNLPAPGQLPGTPVTRTLPAAPACCPGDWRRAAASGRQSSVPTPFGVHLCELMCPRALATVWDVHV